MSEASSVMRILVAGSAGSGQKAVAETITGSALQLDAAEGAIIEHTFDTKYFSQECSLYIDEFEPDTIAQWVQEFTSREAKQVREVLLAFIYTFSGPPDPEIAAFVGQLKEESWTGQAIAVPLNGTTSVANKEFDQLNDWGFDVADLSELEMILHSAIIDFEEPSDDRLEPPSDVQAQMNKDLQQSTRDLLDPLVANPNGHIDELDDIMGQLRNARESDLSSDEKMELARKLAAQLIP